MARWSDVQQQAPDVAGFVEERFRANRHHTMATLRRDGGPRISGTEVQLAGGELWLGSMPRARKAQDLQRDPRVAIHSASVDPDDADPTAWPGDAKVSGRAVEVLEPDELARAREVLGEAAGRGSHLFRVDIDEVVTTTVGASGDHLLITRWTPAGVETFQRA